MRPKVQGVNVLVDSRWVNLKTNEFEFPPKKVLRKLQKLIITLYYKNKSVHDDYEFIQNLSNF